MLTISDLLANGEQEVEDCSERKITESPHRGIKAFSEEKENNYVDRFKNRLIFPIQDIRNRFIAFGGRVLDNSLPKYINSPENIVYSKARNLYGLNVAKNTKTRKLIIVEGYMDTVSLHQRGRTEERGFPPYQH